MQTHRFKAGVKARRLGKNMRQIIIQIAQALFPGEGVLSSLEKLYCAVERTLEDCYFEDPCSSYEVEAEEEPDTDPYWGYVYEEYI